MSTVDELRSMYTQLSRQTHLIAQITLAPADGFGRFTITKDSLIFLLTDNDGDTEVLEAILHGLTGIGEREQ